MQLSFSLTLVEFGKQPSVCSDIDRILDRILHQVLTVIASSSL